MAVTGNPVDMYSIRNVYVNVGGGYNMLSWRGLNYYTAAGGPFNFGFGQIDLYSFVGTNYYDEWGGGPQNCGK